jgi:RNA polymerase sigma factor (TIGR02999 family)
LYAKAQAPAQPVTTERGVAAVARAHARAILPARYHAFSRDDRCRPPSRLDAMAGRSEITTLLTQVRGGSASAMDRLFALVYDELRMMARQKLRHERDGHTLNPTALVHEAYLKLASQSGDWTDRTHFLAVAARAMRQILIDHARARRAAKRGAGRTHVVLDVASVEADRDAEQLIALDAALSALEGVSGRLARIVEYRYFAGLTLEEIATTLELSVRTVQRDWRKARAWLSRELGGSVDAL